MIYDAAGAVPFKYNVNRIGGPTFATICRDHLVQREMSRPVGFNLDSWED